MAREFISELKQEVGRGSTLAALDLLNRSIRFKHKKLAIYRYLIAEQLGAALSEEHHAYCRHVTQSLKHDEISSLLVRVRQFVEVHHLESVP